MTSLMVSLERWCRREIADVAGKRTALRPGAAPMMFSCDVTENVGRTLFLFSLQSRVQASIENLYFPHVLFFSSRSPYGAITHGVTVRHRSSLKKALHLIFCQNKMKKNKNNKQHVL